MSLEHIDMQALVKLRHELHKHPEVSGEEIQTARRISEYLRKYKPDDLIQGIGNHGIAAIYKGLKAGPRIMLRCELDALPIHETNESLPYKSIYDGKSHKCGHDGHMAIMAGLAQFFAHSHPDAGEVVLMFQPAEETGQGAMAVCHDPQFEVIKPDYAFSLHNIPGAPLGQVLCKEGSFSSSVNSMILKIKGVTSHAAEPFKAAPASAVLPDIMNYVNGLNGSSRDDPDYQRAAIVRVLSGEPDAYGTTASDGELHLTLRARTPDKLTALWEEIEHYIGQKIAAFNQGCKHGSLSYEISSTEAFMANINHPEGVQSVKAAAEKSGLEYRLMDVPNDWGEDFGYFTNLPNVKGVMFGLGAGENTPPLHNPDYDFPDELIPKGIAMFSEMVGSVLND